MRIKNILWDLDGTLTDPKVGIITSIQYALNKFGKEPPEMSDLLWCIGPPLYESFPKLVPNSTHEDILKLVELYRERYGEIGLYENNVYNGIRELFEDRRLKHRHYVATSKPHIFARRILSYFKLNDNFLFIHGSELDGTRSDKGDLIKYILSTESLNSQNTVMIGDRKHDILGAKKAGLTSIGVTWGYGSFDEHIDAGADFVFSTPSELCYFLRDHE